MYGAHVSFDLRSVVIAIGVVFVLRCTSGECQTFSCCSDFGLLGVVRRVWNCTSRVQAICAPESHQKRMGSHRNLKRSFLKQAPLLTT